MDRLRRWLGMPETVEDNVVGTLLSTAAVILVFRYGFGDSWALALVLGLGYAPVAFALVEILRRRRLRTGASAEEAAQE